MRRILATLLLLAALSTRPAEAQTGVGVVLMHGLQGSPSKIIDTVSTALQGAGYLVETPEMCWSGRRLYDRPFLTCLAEIDTAIAGLNARGAGKIVVAGQSLGGLAAIAYGARHPNLSGIVAYAPSGAPERINNRPEIAQGVAQARGMLAAGNGEQAATFPFVNMGQPFMVKTSASIYLTFFDPQGPANMLASLRQLRVPLLWVAGTSDPGQTNASAEFGQVPANPLSRFVAVAGGHLETPNAGKSATLDWLRTLR